MCSMYVIWLIDAITLRQTGVGDAISADLQMQMFSKALLWSKHPGFSDAAILCL